MFYLGIDGGGTSCRARVEDHQGQLIGEGFSGSANVYQNPKGTLAAILAATEQAIAHTEVQLNQLHAGIGLAGGSMPDCKHFLSQWQHPFNQVEFCTDAETACFGAHRDQPGGILILGTGICGCTSRYQQGQLSTQLYSGWGFPLADQGSGAWLGLRAAQETLKVFDQLQEPSELTQRVAGKFRNQPELISQWAKQASSKDFGTLAPWVIELGLPVDSRDLHAKAIVAEQLKHVHDLLAAMTQGEHHFPISLMGGLSEVIQPALESNNRFQLVTPQGDALDGAIFMIKTKIGY